MGRSARAEDAEHRAGGVRRRLLGPARRRAGPLREGEDAQALREGLLRAEEGPALEDGRDRLGLPRDLPPRVGGRSILRHRVPLAITPAPFFADCAAGSTFAGQTLLRACGE